MNKSVKGEYSAASRIINVLEKLSAPSRKRVLEIVTTHEFADVDAPIPFEAKQLPIPGTDPAEAK